MFRFRAFLAAIAVLVAATSAATMPAGAAETATPCIRVIKIVHMAFRPPTVFPGQSSTVHVAAVNCTDRTQNTSVTWLGRFIEASGGVPQGCPVIDPVAEAANFAPHGTFTGKLTYLVLGGCTATSLRVTARFNKGAAVLAQRSANLAITQP
jgi:hypothetical protein